MPRRSASLRLAGLAILVTVAALARTAPAQARSYTDTRTKSHPAAASRLIWSSVAGTSRVSVLVMD